MYDENDLRKLRKEGALIERGFVDKNGDWIFQGFDSDRYENLHKIKERAERVKLLLKKILNKHNNE